MSGSGNAKAFIVGAALFSVLAGCSSYSVQRVSVDTEGGVTSRWTDTDARLTAKTMIRKALEAPWLERFREKEGRRPVVQLGHLINRSDQHINTRLFLNHFQDDLINSGKVIVVTASEAHRRAASAERKFQMEHARSSTVLHGVQGRKNGPVLRDPPESHRPHDQRDSLGKPVPGQENRPSILHGILRPEQALSTGIVDWAPDPEKLAAPDARDHETDRQKHL